MGRYQIQVVFPKGFYCRNASFSTLYLEGNINNIMLGERAWEKGIHLPAKVSFPSHQPKICQTSTPSIDDFSPVNVIIPLTPLQLLFSDVRSKL